MGKRLIVAEKASVGREIAKALNCRQKAEGTLIGENDIVTWAAGHLVELCTPEEMDELYIHDTRSPFAKHATYGAPAELVFEKVMEGWHGLSTPYNITEQMTPTPMEMINKAYDRLCRSNTLLSHAEKKARDLSKYL